MLPGSSTARSKLGKKFSATNPSLSCDKIKCDRTLFCRDPPQVNLLPNPLEALRISSALMKAIQLEKPEHFRAIEIAEPNPPGPGEALVRVHRIGICGTDYSGYLGKMPF